ncbi:MAG: DUF3047 domain-containing protein [Alcanivoracaceae bacterium]|nr:DUF3047 domain-containing protein [Alcanivoracaceae bacterium]
MTVVGRVVLACLCVCPAAGFAERYNDSAIPGWQEIVFDGHTDYRREADCVRATASDSASGLIREARVSVDDTTQLGWSWRADALPDYAGKVAEKDKDGDDFVARVYVIHEGFFPWQTRAINYVWSQQHAVGSHWPNPFTGNAVMVVVQSGDEGLGQWHTFERSVRADFARYHDIAIERIDAIAVMTDADNTDGNASACYRLPSLSTSR